MAQAEPGVHLEVLQDGGRVLLRPGDLIFWEPSCAPSLSPYANGEGRVGAPLLVAGNGTDLFFQGHPQPWHLIRRYRGVTAPVAERILNGEMDPPFDGYIYEMFDKATGQSFQDPHRGQ